MIRRLSLLAAATALAACASAQPPAPSIPPSGGGAFLGAASAQVAPTQTMDRWWRLFDDPQLDRLVTRALAANTDLRAAFANLEASRAAEQQARAARLPATVVESGVGPRRADRQPSTSSVPKTSYELGATFAFEIDLFGRLRQAALAAKADAQAVQAARDAIAVTVAADVASAYLDLCAATANLVLARDLLSAQQHAYALTDQQLKAGEVSPLQRSQAAVLRDQAAAAAPVFEADRQRAIFRLATLQGLTPAQMTAQDLRCDRLPRLAAPLPVGDGAALLARRPDIREAESRLTAAAARVGVARAEIYPRIQLGGSGGLIGGGTDGVLTPLITWAFPNQAAPRARLRASKGAEAAQLAAFDGVVLRALEEVEVTLADLDAAGRRKGLLATAAQEADATLRRAEARQRLGADDFLVVTDAQRTRNSAAVQALGADVATARAQIALFRALGGGWQTLEDGAATGGR